MSISIYDISIPSYLQTLAGVEQVLQKGASFCEKESIDPAELVDAQIHPDMLSLRFQLVSVAHHSLGAIKGIERGEFNPPNMEPNTSYEDLTNLIKDAKAQLSEYKKEDIEALLGKDMKFKMGSFELPFKAENFIMSFSLPNFYFHATTAYDILRMKGVKLGKMDYLGQMRVG